MTEQQQLDICPGVGLLDHMVAQVLVSKRTATLLFTAAVPICIPASGTGALPFLHSLSSIYCLETFFDDGHSD